MSNESCLSGETALIATGTTGGLSLAAYIFGVSATTAIGAGSGLLLAVGVISACCKCCRPRSTSSVLKYDELPEQVAGNDSRSLTVSRHRQRSSS